MPFPIAIGPLMLKLIPGALFVGIVGGIGFYLGSQVKQLEVDRLQSQLNDYKVLGQRVSDLSTSIDASIKDKNKSLVEAYGRDIEKVRAEFGLATEGLAEATRVLKRDGGVVKTSLASLTDAISKLPAGNEREEKILQAIAILQNQQTLQQLCTVTAVSESQLVKLKASFALGGS